MRPNKVKNSCPVFPYVMRRCSLDFLVMLIQFTIWSRCSQLVNAVGDICEDFMKMIKLWLHSIKEFATLFISIKQYGGLAIEGKGKNKKRDEPLSEQNANTIDYELVQRANTVTWNTLVQNAELSITRKCIRETNNREKLNSHQNELKPKLISPRCSRNTFHILDHHLHGASKLRQMVMVAPSD